VRENWRGSYPGKERMGVCILLLVLLAGLDSMATSKRSYK